MCIIAVKLAKSKHPTPEQLKAMWTKNDDGAGIAYPDVNGGITVVKGLMTFEAFMEAMQPLLEIENSHYVLHFRIGTHGSMGPDMTHPFWLTENKVALAHNGILPFTAMLGANDERSDTAAFVQDILNKLPEKWYEDDKWIHVVEEYMGQWNKMAVIDPEGVVFLNLSQWIEDKDSGMWYSNTSYRVYTNYVPPYAGHTAGGSQASNFRTPTATGGTTGGSDSTLKKATADFGKRLGSLVRAGTLKVEEARKLKLAVETELTPEEGEDFVDFFVRLSVLLAAEKPGERLTLEAAMEAIGAKTITEIPDRMEISDADLSLDLLEIQATEKNIQFDTKQYDNLTGWNKESAGIFVARRVTLTLMNGQKRIGYCTDVDETGLTMNLDSGGTAKAAWTFIDNIEQALTLTCPRMHDLQTHLGQRIHVEVLLKSQPYAGLLTSMNLNEFVVHSDMGVNITARYDEILAITILGAPPEAQAAKG